MENVAVPTEPCRHCGTTLAKALPYGIELRCPSCGGVTRERTDSLEEGHREHRSAARLRVDDDGRRAHEDRQEALERGSVVCVILERLKEELALLELVPHLNADEVNGLSAAKGYAERAEAALKRGLGL